MGKANCNGWAKWVAGTAITVGTLLVGGYVAFDNDRAAGQATVQSEHGQRIGVTEAKIEGIREDVARVERAIEKNADDVSKKLDKLLGRQ